ncbi:MAG: ABC transporter ATP-binding protein [Gemmatimonadota bacterium]|nr:ABC transporter ATP-binding protein [Gemmatimonadota bacterium]
MSAALPTRLECESPAVATQALSKSYGREPALSGVDVCVPVDAVYVLVGPNGAGKTTLLRTLLDPVRPTSGNAVVWGMDCQRRGPEVRAQIGYVPERHDWGPGWMTVGRLLEHHAAFYPTWDRDYAARLGRAFELKPERPFGKLSKGQARRVQLLTALAHRPPLLLLDEPTDGLDPVMRDETLGILADHLAETGATVLVSTHLVHEVQRLADHVGVLREGELRAQMPTAELHRGLRRYRAEVPEGWAGIPSLNGQVIRRTSTPREVQWTVWGEETEVVQHFAAAGATVRDAAPLSLEDATLALLTRTEDRSHV